MSWDLNTEEDPKRMELGTIVKIPNKWDLTDWKSWRGISLLSFQENVLLHHSMENTYSNWLKTEGSVSLIKTGWSCKDQIFVQRNILEQCKECHVPINLNSVSYQKTFGSVERMALGNSLRIHGTSFKVIKLIASLYKDCVTVRVGGESTKPFTVKQEWERVVSSHQSSLHCNWFVMQSHITSFGCIAWSGNGSTHGNLDLAADILLT